MPDSLDLLNGTLVGRYRIEHELARGGMATVYLATDQKHDRSVVVKVIRPELSLSIDSDRFLREIGIAAKLVHPHVLPLIDSGDSDGLLFYVVPYLEGGSLRDRLWREQQLPLNDALRIAREVGAGLDYAHRVGVVHRDVKPENVLLADGHAVLADFGVARICNARGIANLTAAGIAVGTPEYMSPEQASGEQDLGPRSDIYSLGCVVYEMLAGSPPFSGDSARRTIARQVTEPPPPVRGARPEVPESVERAVTRALAKDPDERFATVAEFIAALDETASSMARPTPSATRSLAVLPFVNGSPDAGNEYLSDGITDELIDALAKVEGMRISSRTSVYALKGKSLDVRAIGALLGVSEVLEGTVRRAGDRLRITAQLTSTGDGRLLWSQRYDRTLDDVFAIQDELARTIVGTLRARSFASVPLPVRKRYTENVTAYSLYLKGRWAWNKRTQEGVLEGIGYFEQAIAEDPNYALAYTGLSDSYALQIDYRSVPVHEGFARAEEYARKALELDDTLAEAHASLAWSRFIYDWDYERAAAGFWRSIELDPRYATAHQWYSFLLASQQRFDEALVEAHTALELDPASVAVRRTVGWNYFYARRYDQAMYHLSHAIEMNPNAEESYRILGLSLAQLGQMSEAERVLREALLLPGAGPYAMSTLGYVLARGGNRSGAAGLLQSLEQRAEGGYVSPVAFVTLHLGLGQWERAFDWMERAHEERRGWMVYLNVHPILDPVRSNPRFGELVRRMGL